MSFRLTKNGKKNVVIVIATCFLLAIVLAITVKRIRDERTTRDAITKVKTFIDGIQETSNQSGADNKTNTSEGPITENKKNQLKISITGSKTKSEEPSSSKSKTKPAAPSVIDVKTNSPSSKKTVAVINSTEDVFVTLNKLKELYNSVPEEASENLKDAEAIVIEKIKDEIGRQYKKFDYSKKAYETLLKLTEEVCSTADSYKSGQLRKSPLYSFAHYFSQTMKAAQNGNYVLSINKIEVISTYENGACIGDCSFKVNKKTVSLVREGETLSHRFYKTWTKLPGFTPPVEISCMPWSSCAISMYVWKFEEGFMGLTETREKKGQKEISFVPARHKGVSGEKNVTGGVRMNIYYNLNYKTLDELYSEYLN